MNIPKLVLKNLTRRKGRFIFTLLGITIGIASFVTLLSLGGGLKSEIKRQARELGANLVVTPKGWCAYEQVSVPEQLLGEKSHFLKEGAPVTVTFLGERPLDVTMPNFVEHARLSLCSIGPGPCVRANLIDFINPQI